MKKILILGGVRFLIPVVITAKKLGYYTITCDYLPENDAHRYSDEFWNFDVTDQEGILKKARDEKIDGIISFDCDPGVVPAAYIAEQLDLPFQAPYESARILQDKGLFRGFLTENGFNVPHSKRYTDKEAPFNDIDFFTWPVIVKPVDSAGSKGVTKVESVEELSRAISYALTFSHNGAFIIEDFLVFEGFHSSADPFVVDGKIKFITYTDQLFDKESKNPYNPAIIIWPTTMKQEHQDYLTSEIQRLVDLLHLTTGIYNIETCVGINGKPYIMEVSPRGGGCRIAEIQELAYGIHFIEDEIKKAVGDPIEEINHAVQNGSWAVYVLHSNKNGCFSELNIADSIKENIVDVDLWVESGDRVYEYEAANKAIGTVIIRANNEKEIQIIIENIDSNIKVVVE